MRNNIQLKIGLVVGLIFGCLLIVNKPVLAEPIAVLTPSIIDVSGKARDIFEYNVKIKNQTTAKLQLYAIVNDIDSTAGELAAADVGSLDRTGSLSSWLEISRGVIGVMPNEEAVVPLKIKVSMYALPGKYYATIKFANGANRELAEAADALGGQPELIINLAVEDNIVERAENSDFSVGHNLNLVDRADLHVDIKNAGNKDLMPKGRVIIYDRKNTEVGVLGINEEQRLIVPTEKGAFNMSWTSHGKLGKFKAKLEVEYGANGKRDLQDTIYFWILPWQMFLLFGGIIFALIFSLILLFIRLVRQKIRRHLAAQEKDPVINLKFKQRK
ncbi:MAG: hypothetical protein WCK11_03520 [Candidatus Falkowbacteria bacterium]